MNERQAYLAIRNAIRLENFSDDIARKIAPELRAIFNELGEQFRTMPPGNIERELWYRQQRLRIADMLAPISREMGQELGARLGEEAAEQMQYAERYLKAAGEDPANLVAAAAPQDGLRVGFDGEGASFGRPQFTRTQLNAITQDVRVMGERLEDLFEPTIGRGEIGPWIRQNLNMIDRKVKAGFLTGQTSDQIAAQFPGFGAEAIRRNKAIARTAVMDLSAKANEEFWQANSDVIAGWEYDATMDNRVCEQCAPWDGEFKEERNKLPAVPLHVNCRCRVLPLTNTEMELRKEEGPQRRSVVELIEAPSKEQAIALAKAKPGVVAARAYAGQVKVNGKKYWRVAKDIQRKDGPLTMGEFLKQASPQTQLQVLGSKKRVSRFMGLVGGRDGSVPLSPDLALKRVVEWKPTVSRKPRMSAQMKLDISQLKSQKELMKKATQGDSFGVYAYLRDSDSTTAKAGSPYYVGKMRGVERVRERHAVPIPKDDRRIRLLKGNLSEAEANTWERRYIARYGRKDLDTGILLNRTSGGEGASGRVKTAAEIAKTARSKAIKTAQRIGMPADQYMRLDQAQRAKAVRQAADAAKYGYSPSAWRTLPPSRRRSIAAAASGGQVWQRYGLTQEEWLRLSTAQRSEAPSQLAKASRYGFSFKEWAALPNATKQSIGSLTASAEKYGVPMTEWARMTKNQRTIYVGQVAKAREYGVSVERWKAMTPKERQSFTRRTQMAAVAAKYGLTYEQWFSLPTKTKQAITARYRRGKRGAALLEGLL